MKKGNLCFETHDSIVLKNALFRLTVGKDALPASLFCLPSGEECLRDPATEHHLFLNEQGEYELIPYRQISVGVGDVRAFLFERAGLCYVLFWHIRGTCDFTVDLGTHRAEVFRERMTGTLPLAQRDGKILLHAGNRLYLVTDATPEETEAAFAAGK